MIVISRKTLASTLATFGAAMALLSTPPAGAQDYECHLGPYASGADVINWQGNHYCPEAYRVYPKKVDCEASKSYAAPIVEAIKRADELAEKEQETEKARQNIAKAQFPLTLKKALSGDGEAQYLAGKAYSDGLVVAKDESSAFDWFSKAASSGNQHGENAVGYTYLNGSGGVAKDYAAALKWFRKAAAQGNAKAEYHLGDMYFNGWGVPQNYALALAYYRKAAVAGFDPAEASIGYMYASGTGVKQDYVEGNLWYRKAANQGNDWAQGNLGINYEHGQGVKLDYATAAFWYRRAAKQGNADAIKRLHEIPVLQDAPSCGIQIPN